MDIADEKHFNKSNEFLWVSFGTPVVSISIYRRCPDCGRFLTIGKVNYHIEFEGWKCSKHGNIKPFYLMQE